MAVGKEIRSKIKSVENTKKITKAMEMVAASKMRKAQERMRAARPYSEKVRSIAGHMSQAQTEYKHPFMSNNELSSTTGMIIVTTDKGLCGGLNTNVLRAVTNKIELLIEDGKKVHGLAIGNKGLGFLNRIGVPVIASAIQLGDKPAVDRVVTPVGVMLEKYAKGELDVVYLCYTRFVNTMKQEVVIEKLLPLNTESLQDDDKVGGSWDYIYEPDAKPIIDNLMNRYIESLVYQAILENVASEQSARMVAMKSATDNAGNVIDELKLIYNKTRQAAITKELSEIVAGAAAV